MPLALMAGKRNGGAAMTCNAGLRSVYFALCALARLAGSLVLLVATAVTAWVVRRREFSSASRDIIIDNGSDTLDLTSDRPGGDIAALAIRPGGMLAFWRAFGCPAYSMSRTAFCCWARSMAVSLRVSNARSAKGSLSGAVARCCARTVSRAAISNSIWGRNSCNSAVSQRLVAQLGCAWSMAKRGSMRTTSAPGYHVSPVTH
ncbi:MAG: DUF599 family protein [Rhodobacteraceae bacterium]|nr:DUF599 family protein [Paracoccaceae bacterium]TVR47286.1 MAG: DUF599 family protein [Paracoccaceae bacterium]